MVSELLQILMGAIISLVVGFGWLDLAEQVCEREDLLSMAEHLMYIARKVD